MNQHCCAEMRYYAESMCDLHPDRFDCAECHIHYDEVLGTYGLIEHSDLGGRIISIDYCPWCGTKLRDASASPNVVWLRPRAEIPQA